MILEKLEEMSIGIVTVALGVLIAGVLFLFAINSVPLWFVSFFLLALGGGYLGYCFFISFAEKGVNILLSSLGIVFTFFCCELVSLLVTF